MKISIQIGNSNSWITAEAVKHKVKDWPMAVVIAQAMANHHKTTVRVTELRTEQDGIKAATKFTEAVCDNNGRYFDPE